MLRYELTKSDKSRGTTGLEKQAVAMESAKIQLQSFDISLS